MNTHRHEYHLSPTFFYSQPRLHNNPRTPTKSHDHRPTTPTAFNDNSLDIDTALSSNNRPEKSQTKAHRQAHPTLPALPRFHPANYAVTSPSTSAVPTNESNANATRFLENSVTGPLSPRSTTALRQYPSEPQRQLYLHQRELLSLNRPSPSFNIPTTTNTNIYATTTTNGTRSPTFRFSRPSSPHLAPLGSPGPVTPL